MKLSHLLTLVLLVIAFGCRKADYLSLPQYADAEKALQLPPNASPTLQRIAKELKRQNNLPGYRGYLNDFFQKEGVPRWDKAQIQISAPRGTAYRSAGQPDTVVVIPLVLENEAAVNGFLQATLSVAAVNIWHYNVGEYDRFPFGDEQNYSAEDFVGLVIKMNYEVFGYKKFQILDNRLFPETSDTSVSGLMKRTFTIKEDSISPHLSVKIPGTFCYMVPSGVCNCATKPYCIDWFNCPSRVCGKEVCIEYVVHVDLDGPYEEDESIFPGGNQNGQNHGGGQGGGAGGSGPTETGGNPLPDCAEAGAQLPSGYYQPCKRGTFIPVIDIEEEEEGRDENGFLLSKIQELNNLLAQNPEFLIDCDELSKFDNFGEMWQRVAQFTPAQSIIDRIEYLEQTTTYDLTDDFYIQSLENATGTIVNCDFFAVRIQQLPPGMTAEGLLENFRKNIDQFINSPITPQNSTSFKPYNDGVSIDDTQLFNSPFENSLGSLVSIYLNLIEKGSVVLSDYSRNDGVNQQWHRFKFSTLATPLDWNHPVSGNREFGIYNPPNAPNELCFYILGVDRTSGPVYAAANSDIFNNQVFSNADKLWKNIQENMAKYIIDNGGQASASGYSNGTIKARPKWNEVKKYLLGEIDLATLKQHLGC